MSPFRPLWSHRIHARSGAFEITRLDLHRHLAGTERLGRHAHAYWQALLYLSGRGEQELASGRADIAAGALVIVPPGVRHAWKRAGGASAAVCLAVSFRCRSLRRSKPVVTHLGSEILNEVRGVIAAIARTGAESGPLPDLRRGARALGLLAALLDASGIVPSPAPPEVSPLLRRTERLLESSESDLLTLSGIAERLGLRTDYLSRRLREETGLSVSQLRNRARLARAKRALSNFNEVARAAGVCGFADPNYFARWFRKQTGMSPLAWKLR